MSFNAYAVLLGFVALVGLVLGAALLRTALRAARRPGCSLEGDALEGDDRARAALLLLGGAVLSTSVAGTVLFVLLLDSLVPLWAGVMCIRGVARIGLGAEGAAGALPALVTALTVGLPVLATTTGAALLLHAADRRAPNAPLRRRVAGLFAAAGALAVLLGAASLAYVGIEKRDRALDRGCCVGDPVAAALREEDAAVRLDPTTAVFWFAATGLAVALLVRSPLVRRGERAATTGCVLAAAAGLALVTGRHVLEGFAARRLLGASGHPCGWCVLERAPLGAAGIGLFVLGAGCALAVAVAGLLAAHRGAGPGLAGSLRGTGRVGAIALLAALGLATVVALRA